MNINYSDIYKNNIFDLASTLVIKSQESIDGINTLLMAMYGNSAVDTLNPNTWKYYLNVSGEYHPTDTVMSVTSLDTLEIITFTKSNLTIHTATKAAYQFGTRYYNTLLASYPNQEQLILGILYPADINYAISVEEGSVLSYNTALVEPQEETLIRDLEAWIKGMLVRWHVRGFNITDSLYPVAQHAVLYLNLIPKIINLRLNRCKTNEVHSFHVRQYLASHNSLDKYLDYLTLKQALFLYRNINYLERNSGKNYIFLNLIDKILSARYIPVAEFTARHLGGFDTNLLPNYLFKKNPLNTVYNVPEKDFFNLEETLTKEINDALDNLTYSEVHYDEIDLKFKRSISSIVHTKMLESSMLDYTDATPYTLTDALINHWGWMSTHGMYKVVMHFPDPRTGEDRTLYTEDAFIYMIYVTAKLAGVDLLTVPTYNLSRVSRKLKPTIDELMSVADFKYITNTDIATWLISNQPNLVNCYSLDAFYTLAKSIFDVEQLQIKLVSQQEHQYTRAIVSTMVSRMYSDYVISFSSTGILFTDWFQKVGLEDITYTANETIALINNLLNNSTGYLVDPTKIVSNIQHAMIGIMKQLSSYSVQYVSSINASKIRPINRAMIRVGDKDATNHGLDYVEIFNGDIIDQQNSAKAEYISIITNDDNKYSSIINPLQVKQNSYIQITASLPNVTFDKNIMFSETIQARISSINITGKYDLYDPTISEKTEFIGYEYYLNLSDTEKAALLDIY